MIRYGPNTAMLKFDLPKHVTTRRVQLLFRTVGLGHDLGDQL